MRTTQEAAAQYVPLDIDRQLEELFAASDAKLRAETRAELEEELRQQIRAELLKEMEPSGLAVQ